MRWRVLVAALGLATIFVVLGAMPVFAANGDTEVTVDSNDDTFSQNKQNEPAVAVDATAL